MKRSPQLSFFDSLTDRTLPSLSELVHNKRDVLLPGLPAERIHTIYANAPGDEVKSGKFHHPESSAALVANTFGIFLDGASEMPALPGCEQYWSLSPSMSLETTLHLPWANGRHPCLDVVVITRDAVIAVESKRYEPYREKLPSPFSRAYWRNVWGTEMDGYEFIRDMLSGCATLFAKLDAAQLVKHAFGLRTAIYRRRNLLGKTPVLVYLYAEPKLWSDGQPIAVRDLRVHRREIGRFANCVAHSEVRFKALSYLELLDAWMKSGDRRIREHAAAVLQRYAP